MDERVVIRDEGLVNGVVEAMIYQRAEGISRGLFLI